MAFLRNVRLIANEVRHHFEAAGDFVHEVQRQMDQLGEDAAQTDPDGEGAFPRFDVNVAGLGVDRVQDETIDEYTNLDGRLRRLRLHVLNRVTLVHKLSVWVIS